MSTTETKPRIADDSEIKESGGMTWRFSLGKIVRGRGDGADVKWAEERKAITGQLRRVGIHRGESNDQYKKQYEQVECDIETAQGLVYVKAGLLSDEPPYELKVSRSVLDFAWGLTQFTSPDETLRITAAQGEAWVNENGKTMSPSTYVNFARVSPEPDKDGKYSVTPLIRPKADRNAPKVPMNDQWLELRKQIEAHPLFAERPNKRDDSDSGPTHFSELCRECSEKGWPTPEEAAVEWLETLPKLLTGHIGAIAALTDYSEDEWGEVRLALQERAKKSSDMPKFLEPAKKRLQKEAGKKASASKEKESDPFA